MKSFMPFFVFLMILSSSQLGAQITNEDFFSARGVNIGNPKLKGSFTYNSKEQNYRLKGAGYNIWNNRDEFFYLSKPVNDDFIFSANLAFEGDGVDPHRKAGLMFRASLDEDAPYVDVAVHGDGLTSMQYRSVKGGETREVATAVKAPGFVQIEKTGNVFTMRISKDNSTIGEVASVEVSLGEAFHAGLFICSHNEEVTEEARFWNVRMDLPAESVGGDQAPPSPSRLEILDIETGLREVVHTSAKHFEAPNWSRNGKFLIFNQDGKLHRFDLKSKKVTEINTGFADANNNDHGISFDGKTLAISHHTRENGSRHSIIYTVPVKGGTPERVTQLGPSYWHGWSPDDKWHVYCAERNGEYDVYKIPATGGEEIRLTTTPGLDDGPEYSPCGKYVYFNSSRTGTMQIWRMAPDGSNQEQVTFDEYNDWFAHPSPDGKWLIFISYLPDVPAGSHPRNKRVMLRLMEVGSSEIRAVAFLYGGQGTINVPSWSPDSKKVAFVSYTY
jgi:TolB protein